jgi:hypothetical protein
MAKYYAVARKGKKTFEGFVKFKIPVERMMAIFHGYGISVDFYVNPMDEAKQIELGEMEEGDYERAIGS